MSASIGEAIQAMMGQAAEQFSELCQELTGPTYRKVRRQRLAYIREYYWHWWDIKHKLEYRRLIKECEEE